MLHIEGEEIINKDKGGPMICHKCGFGHMVDDSRHDIRVLKCWVCGERIYPDHPKRSGALVCSRCGSDMDEKNALSLCKNCLSLLNIHLKGRSYGETVCACGTRFTRKSPTQLFHSKECRDRGMTALAEQKRDTKILFHD
jgi:DNA-directed RNA polymerase subunit M/transcription elongation factor TFIIS